MARPKKRSRRNYGGMRIELVREYAKLLLAQIRQHLGHVISFTRQDLLQLPVLEFDQVGLISRYRSTCAAVRYLLDKGELARMKFPDLCLPGKVPNYQF